MSLNTSCTLNIAGKNSNEAYTLTVPSNLLGFCRYDFSRFLEESSRLCRECMKSGEYPMDRIITLRNSIGGCHRYVENNIRTVFDKIVVDCWIEYICRHGEINSTALWNSLIGCDDPFQNAIFQRLTEYRTHHAINQWINILKIQEYAKKKIDFIFGCKLSSPDEAAVRLNFFDLMFSVAANEQGYSLENIGSVKFCKPGRTVGAPFVYGGVSKEIVKNLFKDVQFADSQPYVSREEGAMSDWEAMDAFAVIKNYLPEHNDSVAKIILKSLTKIPDNVFSPSCFKAMIDLEIDSVINMGGYLQRCAKCGEYFLKNDRSTSDYCDTVHRDGTTCRELMEADAPEPLGEKELMLFNEKAERLYRKMAEKVNFEISQRDFSEWSGNFNVMRNNVISGRATDSDFDDFVEYSEQLANQKMSRAKQSVLAAVQEEMVRPDGTRAQVKPYQFARVDRRELEKQGMLKPSDMEERLPPISEEKKAAEKPTPPVAKIIRGASPTSYHEIPVQNVRKEKEAVIPIKSDVFVGEDFSQPPQQSNTPAPTEQKASDSAQEALRKALQKAEQERIRRRNEENGQADNPGNTAPTYENRDKAHSPAQEERKRPHFPDLEDFPVDYDNDGFEYAEKEATLPDTVPPKSRTDDSRTVGKSVSGYNDELSGGKKTEEGYSSKSEQVKRQWEQRSDVEFHTQEPVKHSPPHIKLPEFEEREGYEEGFKLSEFEERETDRERFKLPEFEEGRKDKDNFVTLVDSRGRTRQSKEELNILREEIGKKEPYGKKIPADNPYSPYLDEKETIEELSLTDNIQPRETGATAKNPPTKAARAVGAYRTVAQMPILDKQEREEESKTDTADDFAKILSNIERNDGFDEDNLPLDQDGVPLSHKTKHVMDALMRNSSVSPSLIYGRRQAAEKNVVIDQDYLEKNGKKTSDKK